MRVQNYWFWQGYSIIKNRTLVDLVSRTIFGSQFTDILDFEPLGDPEASFEWLCYICTLINIYQEIKFVFMW